MTPILPGARPWVARWGEDPWSFNVDAEDEDSGGDGMPGRAMVAGAILRWAQATPEATPEDAAMVFNLAPGFARDAMRPDLFSASSLSEAVQIWSALVAEPTSASLASAVFGVAPWEILEAVRDHYYMFVEMRDGAPFIGHEGE